ncbi:response regulator [Labilibacter sediminis]|nr:response regulator [Labilibacter sediminis]
MNKVVPEKWIQTKVAIGFAIIIAIALVIFTISYFSVISIIKVQNESYGHEKEFTYLNQLIFEVMETEGVARVYGITGDEKYKQEYALHHDSVLAIIDFLPQLFTDTASINGINEIERLYLQKKALMDQLVQINIINLHSASAQSLLASIPDSLNYEITEYTYTSFQVDSVKANELMQVDTTLNEFDQKKRRGFLRRMTDFLGGKNKKEDEKVEEPVLSQQVDSTVKKQVRHNEGIKQIKTKLRNVSRKEARFNYQLRQHENELIKLDRLFTEQLKYIVANIQDLTIERNESRREELESMRSTMIDRLLLLVGSAIFLMLFFIFWISRDITRSRRLKSDIIRSKERVDKLLKVKEQFIAHMSHEIRTPLTSIIGFSEQLSEQRQNKNRAGITERIRLSAEHLNGLINNILDFSMLESGNIQFYKDQIEAKRLMHELYQLFELMARKANIELSYEVDSELDVFQSDSLRLKQVMINLIGNAIKFTSRGSVHFCIKKAKNKLVFIVIDTGIGIPRDKQKTIFKVFNQVNISLSRKYSGTGLGLSISRQIIEAMGGSITLNSTVGKGSTFKFEIPFVQGDPKHIKTLKKTEYDFSNKKIMAIDDDEMICQLIDGILHEKVKRLDVNSTPSMALHAIDHIEYDLFMIDLHMPKIDGLQMLKKIRDKNIDTPVLFLTADMVNTDLKEIQKEANIWVMAKPFTQSQILDKIDEIFSCKDREVVVVDQEVLVGEEGEAFSLEGIKSFTGNDEVFLHSVIQTFITNTDQGIKDMEVALTKEKPHLVISEIAHKLLTGFRQFSIGNGIVLLSALEQCKDDRKSTKELSIELKKLSELWASVKEKMLQFISKE